MRKRYEKSLKVVRSHRELRRGSCFGTDQTRISRSNERIEFLLEELLLAVSELSDRLAENTETE